MSRFTFRGWRVSRFIFVVLLLTLACSGAAHADTWSPGQMITYSQTDWDNPAGPAGQLLALDFETVYQGEGYVQIGAPTAPASGYAMLFDSATAIENYLPQGGPPAALTANLADPTDSTSGVFGASVLTLQLDVDFSDAGLLEGSLGLPLGDVQLFGAYPVPDGTTVRQFLAIANTALGGGSTGYMIPDLDAVAENLDAAFSGGDPDAYAQAFLVPPGTTVTPTPEPSSALLLGVGLLGLGIFRCRRRALNVVSGF